MAITVKIENVGIVHQLGISVAEAAAMLQSGTEVFLSNDLSDEAPESIGVSLADGTRIGALPQELSFEMREISCDFDQMKAGIKSIQRTQGLTFTVEICLFDFSWHDINGVHVLALDTTNAQIGPSKGNWAYNLYHAQQELIRLKKEEKMIRKALGR